MAAQPADLTLLPTDALLRAQLQRGEIGLAIISVEMTWLWANRRLCQMLGYSEEELQGRNWAEMTHPEDLSAELDRFRLMVAGEIDDYEMQKRLLRRDGGVLATHFTASCCRNQDRSVRFVIASLRDLTPPTSSERTLASVLAFHNAMMQVMPVPVYLKDRDGRFLAVNQRFLDLTGLAVAEVIGKTAYEFSPRELAELYQAQDRRLWEGDGRQVYEGQLMDTQRRLHDTVFHKCTLTDGAGHVVGIIGVIEDITERKRAEAALRESVDKYRSVVDNIQDVFYRSDAQGRLLMGSLSGARMFGYESVEDMLGLPLDSFWPDPQERARLLEGIKTHGSVRDFEAILLRRDGTTFNAAFTTHFYCDEHGIPLGTEGIIRDITERKRAEEERLELERRLLHAQKLESLGVLAGGIAHDFNNLLMAILGNLEMAMLEVPLATQTRRFIEDALRAGRRATDLTRQMLAYSGRGQSIVDRMDLNALVRENTALFRAVVPKTIAMRLEVAPHPVCAEADGGQLQQVVMNLLTNAAEAIGDDVGTIVFATGVEDCDDAYLSQSRVDEKPAAGRFVYLEVRDTGCGMDRATRDRLFDPFFSTKFTGRGLGMSAVLGIVRGHRGAIRVASEVGCGTTIRVLLPAPISDGAECADCAAQPEAPDAEIPGERAILVVDDDPAVQRMAVAYVLRLGYRALVAGNGHAAVELLRKSTQEIACVLLDLSMPVLDGVGTFRELRALCPTLPVILCSGYDEPNATRRFAGEALAGFLQKPYSLEGLRSAVEQLLRAVPAATA